MISKYSLQRTSKKNKNTIILIAYGYNYNLSVSLLQSILIKNYFNTYVLFVNDTSKKTKKAVGELIKFFNPLFVGFTVITNHLKPIIELTNEIRKVSETKVVWGGPHIIIDPKEALKYSDIVCVGDGEQAIVKLAENLRNNKTLKNIPNIWFKTSRGTIKTKKRYYEENLNKLPFKYFDYDRKIFVFEGKLFSLPPLRYYYFYYTSFFTYTIMINRFCPYRCSFCINSLLNSKAKYKVPRDINNVLEELRVVKKKFPILKIIFEDDIFPSSESFVNSFAKKYKTKIDLAFFIHLRVAQARKINLKELRNSGLSIISAGLQTLSPRIQKIYNRHDKKEDFLYLYKSCKRLGIELKSDLIIAPFENKIDILTTANFIRKVRRGVDFCLHKLIFFKSYPITENLLKQRIISNKDVFDGSSYESIIIRRGSNLTKKEKLFYLTIKSAQFGFNPNRVYCFLERRDNLIYPLFTLFQLIDTFLIHIKPLRSLIKHTLSSDFHQLLKALFFVIKNFGGRRFVIN